MGYAPFRREANSRGRFRTRPHIVRGEKTHHGGRGIVHKFANAKYRITGDKPSVTRTIKSWQPKTFKCKLFKANARAVNFAVHDIAQTAVDTALAAETGGIKTADTAQREVRNKLKQKYTREALDDYHRALYNIDGRIERTQADLAKLRLDHEEAKKIVAEPFPQQEELDSKEERLKVLTDELNQAAIEAKKNAPMREKTCFFERAKMKRDAARLAKQQKAPKDKAKGKSKKQGIE